MTVTRSRTRSLRLRLHGDRVARGGAVHGTRLEQCARWLYLGTALVVCSDTQLRQRFVYYRRSGICVLMLWFGIMLLTLMLTVLNVDACVRNESWFCLCVQYSILIHFTWSYYIKLIGTVVYIVVFCVYCSLLFMFIIAKCLGTIIIVLDSFGSLATLKSEMLTWIIK